MQVVSMRRIADSCKNFTCITGMALSGIGLLTVQRHLCNTNHFIASHMQ